MGIVSGAVLEAGGDVVGVIPHAMLAAGGEGERVSEKDTPSFFIKLEEAGRENVSVPGLRRTPYDSTAPQMEWVRTVANIYRRFQCLLPYRSL